MQTRRKYTDEELTRAVAENSTFAGTLRALGLVPRGGNYTSVKARIRDLGLSTAHWLGRGHLKGKAAPWVTGRATPLEELLVAESPRRSSGNHLKARLLRAGVLKNECARCGLVEWLGQAITLHLDHVNGNNRDDRLENLRVLCPNCHAQTDTYCGRNWGRYAGKPPPRPRPPRKSRATKIDWPPDDELRAMVERSSFLAVGRKLGVSDNAVRKRLARKKASE